jgi:methylphosphotriester-DNA--protein-cysteine methyltransferase
MLYHHHLSPARVRSLIRRREIVFGGNRKLKIAGNLHCGAGKRMKTLHRVFFSSMEEAIAEGYRPCGRCMREQYKLWKKKNEDR